VSDELAEMRRRLAQLEALEARCRQAEEALRESQAELSAILNHAPVAMVLVDQDRQVRKANRAAAEYANRPAEEMLGLVGGEALRCLHSLDDPKGCGFGPFCETCTLRLTVLDTFETGDSHYRVEARLPLARGETQEERSLLVSTTPVDVSESQMVLVCIEDITKHKRAEEALRESEARYRTLFDSASDAIFIHDMQGRFLEVNQVACERLGYSRKELLQMTPMDIDSQEYAALVPQRIEELRQRGHVFLETAHVRRDGTIIPTELSSRIIEYAGEPAVLSIARDITARKQVEKALQQYTAELEARNEELDTFAHTAAHDLKNPLSLIIGYAGILEDHAGLSPEEVDGYIDSIAQSGRKMGNIIDELLLLSQVRKMEVETVPLDMASIVLEAQRRLMDLIEMHQAEITMPETWPTALGYGPWVEEVWANYIGNGVKYGGQPPRLELGATVQKDGWVRFWIRDDGPGLTPEEQARLFSPFTRLGQAHIKGHGLGLSIVRRIVEKLGGQVGVESEVGQGSVFSFTLPGDSQSEEV
jgi:PAS domain S-box-containing protein